MDQTVPQRKFDYRGSVITIELTEDGEHISARADVHRDGEFVGRVALTVSQADREMLFDKLDSKAKELVDELLAAREPVAAGAGDHRATTRS
jgi:hypothetical protein